MRDDDARISSSRTRSPGARRRRRSPRSRRSLRDIGAHLCCGIRWWPGPWTVTLQVDAARSRGAVTNIAMLRYGPDERLGERAHDDRQLDPFPRHSPSSMTPRPQRHAHGTVVTQCARHAHGRSRPRTCSPRAHVRLIDCIGRALSVTRRAASGPWGALAVGERGLQIRATVDDEPCTSTNRVVVRRRIALVDGRDERAVRDGRPRGAVVHPGADLQAGGLADRERSDVPHAGRRVYEPGSPMAETNVRPAGSTSVISTPGRVVRAAVGH